MPSLIGAIRSSASTVGEPQRSRVTAALGIDVMASSGIVGRGVLLDVAGFLADAGRPDRPGIGMGIDAGLLAATATSANVELRPGDVVCLRTGWMAWYLGLSDEERAQLAANGGVVAQPGPRLSAPGSRSFG